MGALTALPSVRGFAQRPEALAKRMPLKSAMIKVAEQVIEEKRQEQRQ
jgi:hypothetical protein